MFHSPFFFFTFFRRVSNAWITKAIFMYLTFTSNNKYMWHVYSNTTSEQSLNKHSFQFGNDADRLTAVKTNRDPGSSSYNLCMLVVCLRSRLGKWVKRKKRSGWSYHCETVLFAYPKCIYKAQRAHDVEMTSNCCWCDAFMLGVTTWYDEGH